ncbi:hypothetical protein EK904_004296 [Melospiza melodia maxima]|nr:hypothetical protein EK904_004296 [Melospiza melodia maxima]
MIPLLLEDRTPFSCSSLLVRNCKPLWDAPDTESAKIKSVNSVL